MKLLYYLIIIAALVGNVCSAAGEVPNFGDKYLQKYDGLTDQSTFLDKLNTFDLSEKINGYLTGVFGNKYRKIDFFLHAEKEHSKGNYYRIKGKNRLGNNIRPIEGYMQVVKVSKKFTIGEKRDIDNSIHVLFLKYEFKEPGKDQGDGVFYGYASLVDYFDNATKKPNNVWFASDFAGVMKMFVGNWKHYKSTKLKKCIFSYTVCCVFELPYSADFYHYPNDETNEGGFPRIRPEYDNPDWYSCERPSWAD